MKADDLLDLLGDADDGMIAAAKKRGNRKTTLWAKRGAAAACLCLLIAGVIIVPRLTDKPKDYAQMVMYNGAQYFVCGPGEAGILQKCGLPAEITREMAGESLGYLKKAEKNRYYLAGKETAGNAELFEYAPQPNENVYIVRLETEYLAAVRKDGEGYHGLNK